MHVGRRVRARPRPRPRGGVLDRRQRGSGCVVPLRGASSHLGRLRAALRAGRRERRARRPPRPDARGEPDAGAGQGTPRGRLPRGVIPPTRVANPGESQSKRGFGATRRRFRGGCRRARAGRRGVRAQDLGRSARHADAHTTREPGFGARIARVRAVVPLHPARLADVVQEIVAGIARGRARPDPRRVGTPTRRRHNAGRAQEWKHSERQGQHHPIVQRTLRIVPVQPEVVRERRGSIVEGHEHGRATFGHELGRPQRRQLATPPTQPRHRARVRRVRVVVRG